MTNAPTNLPVRGRFAPSPTGRLHLGNMRTAMLAWLQARRSRGTFILRIEDLDPLRTLPEGTRDIMADLQWLGFNWDEGPDVGGPHAPYFQSARREQYRAALAQLREHGLVYPCTCSRKDLLLAGAPHAGEEGPRYPGTCRAAPGRQDRAPAYRFRLPAAGAEVSFSDSVAGPQSQNVDRQTGDFVVWRVDDWPSYQLAVVHDDINMRISDVVRGADLLSSVGRQSLLYQAFGARPPRWHHVPLWLDRAGERLAKRNAAQTVAGLRGEGARPEAVIAQMAASLGWGVPAEISLSELLDDRFMLP